MRFMVMPDHQEIILLVDDNVGLLEALSTSIEALSAFKVVCAADGIEGLEKCLDLQPACVVIDVKMPGLTGIQLVQALRGDPQTSSIPLVILTALAKDKDQFLGLAAGADQYLIKPIKSPELVAAIHRSIA